MLLLIYVFYTDRCFSVIYLGFLKCHIFESATSSNGLQLTTEKLYTCKRKMSYWRFQVTFFNYLKKPKSKNAATLSDRLNLI